MSIADVPDPDWYLDNVLVPAHDAGGAPVGQVRAARALWRTRARQMAGATDTEQAVQLAREQGFVLTARDLRSCGVPLTTSRRMLRRGTWWQAGYGCIAVLPASEYGERDQQVLRASAAALKRGSHTVSAVSAALMHGLPTMTVPGVPWLSAAEPTSTGCLDAAQVHVADLAAADLDSWFGVPVTSIARTVADLARFDDRSGLMAANAALHEELLTVEEVRAALDRVAGRAGVRRCRETLALADARIESPLESLTLLALHDSGFPQPELQYVIDTVTGRFRVDFAWPEQRVVLEVDGRLKYRGGDADRRRWREKQREVALGHAGWRVIRLLWADVVRTWPASAALLAQCLGRRPGQLTN